MAKMYLKITPEEAPQELLEVAKMLINLRKHSKHWQTHFGSENKKNMVNAENLADKWIEENILMADDATHKI